MGAILNPETDIPRMEAIRRELTEAYSKGDAALIAKAACKVREYVDEGLNDYKCYNDDLDPYEGYEPELLADEYIQRVFLDRYRDDDDDQKYIETGMRNGDERNVNHQLYKRTKVKFPDAVILFSDVYKIGYYAFEDDADTLHDVLDVPLFDWDGVKAAAFPYNALDIHLPRLIRTGHRVAICDHEGRNEPKRKHITETVKPIRREAVQLSFNF